MSRTFWLRMLITVPASLTVQWALGQNVNLVTEVGSVGAFVTAIGTLYSVLTGFTVISVWQQFVDTDRAVKREARALSELWRYVGYVEDADGVARARSAIERYRDEVVTKEWPTMIARRTVLAAEGEYFEMADAVNAIKVATRKDVPAWAEAVRTLGEVSDARGERAVFVAVRMPALLRLLIYVATFSLIIGMALLGFVQPLVGVVVLIVTIVVSFLVLEVIDDLDDPFTGAWAISNAPFTRIRFSTTVAESPN